MIELCCKIRKSEPAWWEGRGGKYSQIKVTGVIIVPFNNYQSADLVDFLEVKI